MRNELALTPEAVKEVVAILRVLADPTRLRIIGLLRGRELNVTSLCELLTLAQPTVSHHLGLLRGVSLVNNRRDGKQVFYSLNESTVRLNVDTGEMTIDAGPVELHLVRPGATTKAASTAATTPQIAVQARMLDGEGAGTSRRSDPDLVASS